jgi:MYXO-CTERM domain-containing protein
MIDMAMRGILGALALAICGVLSLPAAAAPFRLTIELASLDVDQAVVVYGLGELLPAASVRISGISDGVNLATMPGEFGTIFTSVKVSVTGALGYPSGRFTVLDTVLAYFTDQNFILFGVDATTSPRFVAGFLLNNLAPTLFADEFGPLAGRLLVDTSNGFEFTPTSDGYGIGALFETDAGQFGLATGVVLYKEGNPYDPASYSADPALMSATVTVAPVPAPGAGGLLAGALGLLALHRRRRSRLVAADVTPS